MKKMEKRYLAGLLMLIFLLSMGYAASTTQAKQGATPAVAPAPGPNVVVSPIVAPIDKKAKIIIMGSGFDPGQEVIVLFEDEYGALSVLQEIKANKHGSWATVWTLGRYTRRGIIKEGVYPIMATDQDYNIMASAPVGFVKPTSDPKKWPDWAKAAKIKPKKKKK